MAVYWNIMHVNFFEVSSVDLDNFLFVLQMWIVLQSLLVARDYVAAAYDKLWWFKSQYL